MTAPWRRRLTAALLVGVVLSATACGSNDEGAGDDEPSAAEKSEDAANERISDGRVACTTWVGPVQAELTELDSRLSVGLVFQDYITAVGDVRVVYDTIDFESYPDAYCLEKVAVPLENALIKYSDAANAWNACISDFGCDYETDTLPGLQQAWAEATTLISDAKAALADYQDPETFVPNTGA